MSICVVHLVWAPGPMTALPDFLASYRRHPAGVAHTLVLAFNGFEDRASLKRVSDSVSALDHEEFVVPAPELDLTIYRQVAERRSEETICFLNSYSRIMREGWLAAMVGHLESPEVGIVGPTGSYESHLSSARLPLRLLRAGRYPPFPNPHLRTNGFVIDRDLMLDLDWPRVGVKRAAWELESGTRGVTRQIEQRGHAALVIGRDGHAYPREQWPHSRTFRAGEQENLLIHDNRTRQFDEAPPRLRRRLTRLAWGDPPVAAAPRRAPAVP